MSASPPSGIRQDLLAESRVPDPGTAPPIRWGILAPGGIARAFAAAVRDGTAGEVVAVGSRSAERAAAFAAELGIARHHGGYEQLAADDEVDAIYIASPHSEHHAHALLALEAGKPVLVEKAFTRNAAEAREVLAAGRRRGLLVAEAMWSRYLPHYDVVRQVIESGRVGDVVSVVADHSQPLHPIGPERLAAPELAGGALLDLGVYVVNFADLVLGPSSRVTARARLTERGVDATTSIIVESTSGAVAVLSTTMLGPGPCTAVVVGTAGRLELDHRFYAPTTMRLYGADGGLLEERPPGPTDHAHGFAYEAAEFARCLAAGASESESMPHATTLRVMETMDEIRRQVGVTYPGE
jgi:predicted dehydrogenase